MKHQTGLVGVARDLTSYMAQVKIAAARHGLKTYGAATATIQDAYAAGSTADQCIDRLKRVQEE